MKKDNSQALIVANWKMNMQIETANNLLAGLLSQSFYQENVVLCPPFTLLGHLRDKLDTTEIKLGAQDCSALSSQSGAYTGDISAEMLKNLNCEYVICGHSERRHYYQEDSQTIKNKIINAHKAGLNAILCIGENLSEREQGNYKDIILHSLKECLPDCATSANTIVAYEPIWAIGTGKTASKEQIEEIHLLLHNFLVETFEKNTKIIYGGSVNEENAASILQIPFVSGLLVGGASLDFKKFYKIIKSS